MSYLPDAGTNTSNPYQAPKIVDRPPVNHLQHKLTDMRPGHTFKNRGTHNHLRYTSRPSVPPARQVQAPIVQHHGNNPFAQHSYAHYNQHRPQTVAVAHHAPRTLVVQQHGQLPPPVHHQQNIVAPPAPMYHTSPQQRRHQVVHVHHLAAPRPASAAVHRIAAAPISVAHHAPPPSRAHHSITSPRVTAPPASHQATMTKNRTTKNPSISSACKVNTNITVPNNLIRGNTIVRHVTEDFGGQYRVVKLGSSLSRTSKIWNSVNGGQQMFMVQPGRRSNSNNNNEKGGAAKNVSYSNYVYFLLKIDHE